MSHLPTAPSGDAPVGRAPISIAGSPTALSERAANAVARHPEVETRLSTIEGVVASLSTGADAAFQATQNTLQRLNDAQAVRASYLRDVAREGRDPDTTDLATHDRAIANAKSRHAAAHQAASRATAIATSSREALRDARGHLNRVAASGIKVARAVKLDATGLTELMGLIETQRAELAKLAGEMKAIEDAPMRIETARETIGAKLADLFRRGKPTVSITDRHVDIILPTMRINATPLIGSEPVEIVDAGTLAAYLHRHQIQVATEEELIVKYANIERQLDVHEKAPLISKIAERRLAVERTEVATVLALWDLDTFTIGLRRDTDARALLGIE